VAKKVMVGDINPATGEQKPAPYTASEGVTDPDGNALLTAAAGGGSPVSTLKGATVVASGSIAAATPGVWARAVIALDTVNAHRFYWGSCLAYARSGWPLDTLSVNHHAGVYGTTDGAGFILTPQHQYIIEYFGTGGTSSVSYKVYRIDES
jgi:hypothetical protein